MEGEACAMVVVSRGPYTVGAASGGRGTIVYPVPMLWSQVHSEDASAVEKYAVC